MTQNMYDQADFFAAYSNLERSLKGLDGAPEWPALISLIPDLRGAHVLDLGCGFGWFSRWAVEKGADKVLGIDVSLNMLDRARTATSTKKIDYRQADLETLRLGKESFDFVYSSLALHYIEHLPRLFEEVQKALRPGGQFLFSVEHPVVTAPSHQEWIEPEGIPVWPLNQYLDEGKRIRDWLAPNVVKQHRTLAGYLNSLISAGFSLRYLEEWGPSAEQIATRPEWAKERERPPFLLTHVVR